MTPIVLRLLQHQNKEWIGLYFENLTLINAVIKKQTGAKWSRTHQCWYIPLSRHAYKNLMAALEGKARLNDAELKLALQKRKSAADHAIGFPVVSKPAAARETKEALFNTANKEALKKFIEHLQLKAYSASTIKTYRNEFIQLLQVLKNKPVNELTVDDLKRYMVFAMEKQGISENTAHSRLNALKFYFEQVLGREKFFWEIPRPKKANQLPKVFSQDEIAAIINNVTNKKHKVMLMLAYSGGLRVSEVVSLKTYQIDSKRMTIFINAAKGKKDRLVTLSPVLLVMLREYAGEYKPNKKGYLFEGSAKDTAYSSRSLQEVIQAAKKKAGVIRPGSIHSLRHSFATHLIEKGTDVTMIQKLLGHNDIKTTLIYLHTSNKDLLKIISPLDDLKLD